MRVQREFVIAALALGLTIPCFGQPVRPPAPSGVPADRELAAWVEAVEGVFDPVLELRAILGPCREGKRIDGEKAIGLWGKIAPRLPKDDLLRQRTCYAVAEVFAKTDPARAARIAEECTYPAWSASLYRRAGKVDDAERMDRLAKEHARRKDAFRKEAKRFLRDEADINDWLRKQPVMQRIEFLTTGVDGPWARQCGKGFSHFVASLPENVRLRRVMTLYYTPCVEDNFNSVDGELNLAEPILRTTATAFPDKLGRTYRLLVRVGMGENTWFSGPLRIPGDWGTHRQRLVADGRASAGRSSGQGGDSRGHQEASRGEEDAYNAVSLAGSGGLP